MKLCDEGLRERAAWEAAGVRLPQYNWKEVRARTLEEPVWVHIGPGNIFRGYIALLQQALLERGLADVGIVAADTHDAEIVERVWASCDGLGLSVSLMSDGSMEKRLVASVAAALRAMGAYPLEREALRALFRKPSLQLVSLTITEKGYSILDLSGGLSPDIERGPENCAHAMAILASLMLDRYAAGGAPIAAVSMDNCSRNGERLRASVLRVAQEWRARGLVPTGFIEWLSDEGRVSFPWTMIDKITPRPAEAVAAALERDGIEGMAPIVTAKGTFIAPFVNAEAPQYLVIEDRFPNGRPALEAAGVYMVDRERVNRAERMKVTTCLNPLHTALAVFGCLLGFDSIAAEMRDPALRRLVEQIGYTEGMRVVTHPGMIDPRTFLREVIEERLTNPFIPDTPQRIATDTSQKLAVRFGETIKSYAARPDLDPAALTFIPLTIAGWLRYLLALDDSGGPMRCSDDPLLSTLQRALKDVRLGMPESARGKLAPILRNAELFGVDLCALGLGEKIEGMFGELIAGPGAVRATLERYLRPETDAFTLQRG